MFANSRDPQINALLREHVRSEVGYEIHAVDDRVTACPKCPFRSSTRNLPQERLRNWQVRQHDTQDAEKYTALGRRPSFSNAVPLIPLAERFTALQPSPLQRRGARLLGSLPRRPPQRPSITLHLVTARSLQTAFRMKLYIWRPSFRRPAKNRAAGSPTFFPCRRERFTRTSSILSRDFPFLLPLFSLNLLLKEQGRIVQSCFHLWLDPDELSVILCIFLYRISCQIISIDFVWRSIGCDVFQFTPACRNRTRRRQARPGSVSSSLIRNTVFFTRYGYTRCLFPRNLRITREMNQPRRSGNRYIRVTHDRG